MLIKISKFIYNLFKCKIFIITQLTRRNKIHPFCTIHNSKNVSIGKGITIKSSQLLAENGKIHIEDNCWINYDVEICPEKLIHIGKKTSIQKRTTINGNVKIGEECIIAPNVFISSGTHIFKLKPELTIREQEKHALENNIEDQYDQPVTIGRDVWIGTNAVIMPGIEIADHCIIGANAVITKNLASGQIVAGVPAKVIGQRKTHG